MTAIPPAEPPKEPDEVESLKEKYRAFIKRADMFGALKGLDALVQKCIALNRDDAIVDIAHNCFLYLSPDLKYENLVNQYNARRLNEVTLFYLHEEIRRRTFLQSFALGRTLLTPARKRQLAKTMNHRSRVFAFGLNSNHCLGVDSPNMAYVDIPTEIMVPPVYEIRMSSTHTVFWCHDGIFYGCGETKKFMVASNVSPVFKSPARLDFRMRRSEVATGFRALENGTLFESDLCLYFVGDYPKSASFLRTIHDAEFEHYNEFQNNMTWWICYTRPKHSIMYPKLDDAKNVATIRLLGNPVQIQVFPGYWTDMTPGYEKRRPICYLLDGQEIRDIRIENVAAGTIWVLHQNTAYHGTLTLMMKKDNDDDERNLNNYILLVELHEYRTPTPFVCTGVVANTSDSVILKCGDYPNVGFDFLELSEDRNRPKVHKMMFETVDEYMTHGYDRPDRYVKMKDRTSQPSMDNLLANARSLLDSGILERELKLDWMGRLQDDYRYVNYVSLLCYMTRRRVPGRPPKCFDVDIDTLIDTKQPEHVVPFRMKQLCEEFERVNFPGTDVWVPTNYTKVHVLPEEDPLTEGQYKSGVIQYCFKEFLYNVQQYRNGKSYDPKNEVTRGVVNFMTCMLWMIEDLANVVPKAMKEESDTNDGFLNFLSIVKHRCEDQQELMYPSMSPIEVFRYKFIDERLSPEDLDEQIQIRMKFTLTPRDRELDLIDYEIRTYPSFLNAQNSNLIQYVTVEGVLDLNKLYPDDPKIHRLIVQTHFIGHGFTDLDGCEKYAAEFEKLGYELIVAQKYMHKGQMRSRGYLALRKNVLIWPLISMIPTEQCTYELQAADGTQMYCDPQLRKIYSSIPFTQNLPTTLSKFLLFNAIRCLYDRRNLENLNMEERVAVIKFYHDSKMHDAWLDLIKYTILDAMPIDSPYIKELFDAYPIVMQRYVAQWRPSMLLWAHVPISKPRVQHITIILGMWPKNDYERATRVPPKQVTRKNGKKEDTVFRLVSNREWRKFYTNNEERLSPRFASLYEKDFPIEGVYKPYKPSTIVAAPPSVSSAAPLAPDKRRGITLANMTTTSAPAPKPAPAPAPAPPQTKEDKMRLIMERFSEKRGRNGRKTRRK